MTRITKEMEINVPVEKVFNFVADYTNATKYTEHLVRFEPTTEIKRGNGARFDKGYLAIRSYTMSSKPQFIYEVSRFLPKSRNYLTSTDSTIEAIRDKRKLLGIFPPSRNNISLKCVKGENRKEFIDRQ